MNNILITRTFKVCIANGDGTVDPAKTIEAAYFKDEGQFTVFKDVENQVVFSVQSHHLVSVERVAESKDGQTVEVHVAGNVLTDKQLRAAVEANGRRR
ncbi:hypothetical protein QMK19_03595 [Streptomyces sp. H10-C2]|uniref:hypothetical protein n=1 Tax=unclassified Streptomyces TaxID=2593676 RepID=UPI0024B88384|nr:MULTISPECIES: hypothetical protein [unclassified Streptomyces]MDJ0342271.1 hypothetical protein [Streptomyces sp. PH10-H1]MDJ0368785.1 hypothetical protein [Streptomyces sp. H10-C2]